MPNCISGTLTKILYTTARCTERVNPKRPTWRCKSKAEWLWEALEPTEAGGHSFAADWKCDEHVGSITCTESVS